MKKIIFTIFIGIISFNIFSQTAEDFNPYSDLKNNGNKSSVEKPKFDIEKAKRMDFSMEFGTGVDSYMRGTGAFYSYMAPSMRYAVNPKLHIRMGILAANINANNLLMWNSEGLHKVSGNILQTWFYTAADYYATDRLRITGEILYGNSSFGNKPGEMKNNPKAFSVGAEYKINDNLQIGIKLGERQYSNDFFIPGNTFGQQPNGF
jgi:hypothetical protein